MARVGAAGYLAAGPAGAPIAMRRPITESGAERLEPHLATCAECAGLVASAREFFAGGKTPCSAEELEAAWADLQRRRNL